MPHLFPTRRSSDHNFNHGMTGRPQNVDLVSDGFTATGKWRGTLWAAAQIGRPLTEEEQSYVTEVLDDRKMNEIRARIEFEVKDPATAEALKPWHRRWCKRPLFSDDYLPTFNRPNVTLVDTAGKALERITETGVVVAGEEYEVDSPIFATGFEKGN